ncbi:MAG: bifunctional precorrin-2 dehydrogenase/sirohydrochlorin ferrochelatase [Actinomycetota bacterium]|nr:bifunctional precorrin-2 dehydrogenase/sirohydrochlorin ferrochelatase [Actinomycetota bacterium]
MAFRFPVALEVAGRRCVVVGGGADAEHRARALLDCDAHVIVLAAAPIAGLVDLDRRGQLILVRRPYLPGDLDGAFLVVATDSEYTPAVFADAENRGVLCHAVDDPARCHFAMPSVLRRGELTVAVSTGGRAPALAKRLRHRLEEEIPPEYAALVDLLADARTEALANRPRDFATWARRWQAALADLDHLLALMADGRRDEVRRRVLVSLAG